MSSSESLLERKKALRACEERASQVESAAAGRAEPSENAPHLGVTVDKVGRAPLAQVEDPQDAELGVPHPVEEAVRREGRAEPAERAACDARVEDRVDAGCEESGARASARRKETHKRERGAREGGRADGPVEFEVAHRHRLPLGTTTARHSLSRPSGRP